MIYWIFLLILPILLTAGIAGVKGAPWVPTKRGLIQGLVKELPVKPGMRVYDLGCGDGRVLSALNQAFPDAFFIGHEISLLPYLVAKLRAWRHANIQIQYRDVSRTHYADADILFLFWMSDSSKKLLDKLAPTLKPKTLIAVEGWKPTNAKPAQIIHPEKQMPIFLYRAEQWQ